MHQSTSNILMIRPKKFVFNEETALSNAFQRRHDFSNEEVKRRVHQEFDRLVEKLRQAGVTVLVVEDTPIPPKPDAVFPNNWVMFHHSGDIILFPLEAQSRRTERRMDVIKKIKDEYKVKGVMDFTEGENEGKFLESTGSVVFDHTNKLAYACISPRTDRPLLEGFCEKYKYVPVIFNAVDSNGKSIYHTNVMMCVGSTVAVICSESIQPEEGRTVVLEKLQDTGHEVVDICYDQMHQFAGNMLEVRNKLQDELLVMSSQAYNSLNPAQLEQLNRHVKIVHSPLDTIEQLGGGSARCMMAEIFLNKK